MLSYFLRRLLLAIPTLLVISWVTFAMSRYSSGDPVKADYWEKPAAYIAEAKRLGLDQPVFYFTLTNAAFPDTLHRILPLEHREQLIQWTQQCGNWAAVWRFWQSVTVRLDPAMDSLSGPVLVALKNLRYEKRLDAVPGILARVQAQTDTLENQAVKAQLQEATGRIEADYKWLIQHPQRWKLYIPSLHWHGWNNSYHEWFSSFISGNPGTSIVTGNPLLTELRPRLIITLLLNGISLLLAYLIGVPLGVLMARHYLRPFDRLMRMTLLFLYAMPLIWLGSLLIMLFARQDIGFGLINGINAEPWLMSGKPFGQWFSDNAAKFVLPVLTLTVHATAVLAMQMRSGMLAVVRQDFIRTARAKGLSESRVYWQHAFRNALFPIITIFANFFPALFSGSLVVEYLFDFPGMGFKMWKAFTSNDYSVLFAMVMFVSFITILGTILADLLYAWVDPRVRFVRR